MSVYFIGCLHLGHKKVSTIRGFQSTDNHDKVVIDGINSVVGKDDKLFILGDITMCTDEYYHKLDLIAGRKHVVLGNHDRHQDIAKLLEHVDSVCGCVQYKKHCILSHIPVHPMCLEYGVRVNIHAHIHDNLVEHHRGYCNVDAAILNYLPVSYERIKNYYSIED